MNPEIIRKILEDLKKGSINVDDAMEKLKYLPFEIVEHATIDHHRALRKGFPEVILGEGKSSDQIMEIIGKMEKDGVNLLVTRVEKEKAEEILKKRKDLQYSEMARTLTLIREPMKEGGRGTILVVTAGTSDIPVAEEAVVTAGIMGNRTERLYDVGVAGIHRLFGQMERISRASVIIVVAGMEGALPSVISGLVDKPVIAVPTSSGYGASFGGIAALLSMLNSCASGVAVVNIDNGFGAAYIASLINHL